MIICICRRITDRQLVRCARQGLSFDDAQMQLGVSSQCGKCEGCARDVMANVAASEGPICNLRRSQSDMAFI